MTKFSINLLTKSILEIRISLKISVPARQFKFCYRINNITVNPSLSDSRYTKNTKSWFGGRAWMTMLGESIQTAARILLVA